jgi:hypothetical protein
MNQYGARQANGPPPPDARNGSFAGGPRVNGRPANDVESNQARAARFEDEKKRIIESCFSKRDDDGTQLESYITHVRIIEDAMYPSSPPPPDSAPVNKKPRIILVAVRRSGKVRVHKARENASGTFSIGKTWSLDELTAIQSYTAFMPGNQQEAYEKNWAGQTGFIVSLGKPYYWQATTSKEKDFYIASLLKIYRKYTGGKLPQLIGFPAQDLELLAAASPAQTPTLKNQTPPMHETATPSPPPIPAAVAARPQSPYSVRAPSRGTNRSDSQDPGPFGQPRDGQRGPSEDLGRSPRRMPAQPPPSNDSLRSNLDRPPPQDAYGARQPFKQEVPQPEPPPRPSMSPKSSQNSLPRVEKRIEPPVPTPAISQFEAARRNLAAATKSQESVGAGSDYSSPSRSAIPALDRKTPEPIQPKPRVSEEQLPGTRKIPLSRSQTSFEELSNQKTTNTTFYTPLQTPLNGSERTTPNELPKVATTNAPNTEYFNSKVVTVPNDAPNAADTASAAPIQAKETETPPAAPVVPPSTSTDKASEESSKDQEEFRPGLGPMLKKKSGKEIANQFRKAALAASAFQPRQGGAGARLKAMQDKTSNEPDGITGVVPAPLMRGMSSDSVASAPSLASPGIEKERPSTPLSNVLPRVHLQRTATEDSVASVKATAPVRKVAISQPEEVRPSSPEKARSKSPQRKKRQRQEAEIEKFCTVLGLDARIMESRGADFMEILTEFGWKGRLAEKQKMEDFESGIRREIGRAQATGWLGHIEQQEHRVQDLATAFDKAIAECEEMDGLLTLYSHELDTLHEDIEYIEAQSQGLQVQTANQKLLQGELQSLLATLSISPADLQALESAPLDEHRGIKAVEQSLIMLYKAMVTIDPEIRQNQVRQAAATKNDRTGVGVYADTEIGQMRAVRQKKTEYREEASLFVRRFNLHMTALFKSVEERSSEDNQGSLASSSSLSLILPGLQKSRSQLWSYGPMVLFVREVNPYEWQTLISSYEISIKSTYQEHFRDFVMGQKRGARKATGEEQELLFTHQEKDKGDDSVASVATRKLTVKRGKTVKSSALRQTVGDRADGKPEAWEIFDTVLQEQGKKMSEEQNFIVHFFHLSSQSTVEFVDHVSSRAPESRTLPNLESPIPYDPDTEMTKKVVRAMEGIFSFWEMDLQSLVDWVLATDKLQGVGILYALEKCQSTYEETNQQHIVRTTRAISERLTGLFKKFVEDQVKAIEETKVKVNKRKGIISFMKTFPVFSAAVEAMVPHEFANNDPLPIRFVLDEAYGKILKAMWESLNFIAKDNPASGSGGTQVSGPTSGDPEDKEALNYHILLIENMSHFAEEVETQKNVVLEEWKDRALSDMYKHLTQYTDAVIRRPLGKWLDFVESTEALMKANESSASIATKPSHSRTSAKKILTNHDLKEIRKGVETLKKRVEKHFGDVDDPANTTSKSLITRVFDECAARYSHAHDRMKGIIDSVYEGNLEMEWRKEEVTAMFKR